MHLVNNQDRTWASPAAAGPVSAHVRLPASKSITNRALVLAALGDGPAVITMGMRSWIWPTSSVAWVVIIAAVHSQARS